MKGEVTLSGIDEVQDMLDTIAPRQGLNIMRSTIHAVAGQIAKDAKSDMPVDEGDMKRGTKSKRERVRGGKVMSTVRVAGAFYWRFLEYGQGPDRVEHAMFMKAVARYRANATKIFVEQFGKKFEAALARARKR